MIKRKLPRDPNERAFAIVELATRGEPEDAGAADKNPAAVALGRLGGRKGGRAMAAKLTPEERSERGRRMVAARWAKYRAERASA